LKRRFFLRHSFGAILRKEPKKTLNSFIHILLQKVMLTLFPTAWLMLKRYRFLRGVFAD
jgi:hypothetical protein